MRPEALLREEARKIWFNTRLAYWPTLSRRSHDVRSMVIIVLDRQLILLDCPCSPKGTAVLSMADADVIRDRGVAVVECSWAKVEEIPWAKIRSPVERLCAPNSATIQSSTN